MIIKEPCPFCGREPQIIKHVMSITPFQMGYDIECTNELCLIAPRTRIYATAEEALEVWNKRSENK